MTLYLLTIIMFCPIYDYFSDIDILNGHDLDFWDELTSNINILVDMPSGNMLKISALDS